MTMHITSLCSSELSCGFHHTEDKIHKIQVPYSSLQGTGSESWLPRQPHLLAVSLSLPSSHSCFLTVHKPIITGAFLSVLFFFSSLPWTLIIMPQLTPSHCSLVPVQQLQKALLPPSVKNLLTTHNITLLSMA